MGNDSRFNAAQYRHDKQEDPQYSQPEIEVAETWLVKHAQCPHCDYEFEVSQHFTGQRECPGCIILIAIDD